jgi:hypothetical protein
VKAPATRLPKRWPVPPSSRRAAHPDSTSFGITLAKKSVFTEQQEQWLSIFRQFDLTPLQKRIVICGMNGRQISQQDIYKAISTNDLSVYQREVSGIRNSGILVEIRTNPQALAYARHERIDKALVPRFRIQIPASPRVTESNLSVFVSNLPYSASMQEVQTLFESCGRVHRIDLPEPKQRGGDFRFGFVTFYELEAVQKAIKDLNGALVHHRIIAVRKYIPKAR